MVSQESFDALQAEHALLKNNVDIFYTNYTNMKNDFEAVKAQVAAGEAIIQELRKRTTENNKENDDKRRIANAHLLKGKEPPLGYQQNELCKMGGRSQSRPLSHTT